MCTSNHWILLYLHIILLMVATLLENRYLHCTGYQNPVLLIYTCYRIKIAFMLIKLLSFSSLYFKCGCLSCLLTCKHIPMMLRHVFWSSYFHFHVFHFFSSIFACPKQNAYVIISISDNWLLPGSCMENLISYMVSIDLKFEEFFFYFSIGIKELLLYVLAWSLW